MLMEGTYTPASTGDPYFANTTFLVNYDANNANNLIGNVAPTLFGSVSVTSTESKFGTHSVNMTGGSGGYGYDSVSPNAFASLNSNFTCEFWFYQPSGDITNYSPSRGSIFLASHHWTAPSTGFKFYARGNGASSGLNKCVFVVGTTIILQADGQGTDWNYSDWHHMAVVRSGSSWAMWCNGTRIATATSSATVTLQTRPSIGKGSASASNDACFKGYVDSIRWSNIARYDTSSMYIDVPTADWPTSA